jgi:Ser/Thr protein kinase RdoA (MazF antagonist)
LHLSPDLTRIPRIRYEAQLLQALSDKNLPFLLPVPLRANNGDIVVLFEQEQGTTALATLSHLLPGNLQDRSPERDDPLSASHAGFTLALLDAALATLPDIQPPDRLASLPTFGQLAHWHPLASNPLAAVEQLPIDRQSAQQICTFLSDVLESVLICMMDSPNSYFTEITILEISSRIINMLPQSWTSSLQEGIFESLIFAWL